MISNLINKKMVSDLIKIVTNDNCLTLIYIRCTDEKYFEPLKIKVENIIQKYSLSDLENKFPDKYIYEKQLLFSSFFYKKLEQEKVELGFGLFCFVLNLYKKLKKEIFSDEAFIDLCVYPGKEKIFGYSNTSDKLKKINIVKDLSLIIN
jgi:hypothetical protein